VATPPNSCAGNPISGIWFINRLLDLERSLYVRRQIMKHLFALALATMMVVTGVSPLMAANADVNVQGVPNRGASPGQIATGAVVGAVLIGGTTFFLTNRRNGETPNADSGHIGHTPFLIFTHGSTHIHS
jgi:hypothetical protein